MARQRTVARRASSRGDVIEAGHLEPFRGTPLTATVMVSRLWGMKRGGWTGVMRERWGGLPPSVGRIGLRQRGASGALTVCLNDARFESTGEDAAGATWQIVAGVRAGFNALVIRHGAGSRDRRVIVRRASTRRDIPEAGYPPRARGRVWR